jgi:hypothetical protein
VVVVKKTRTTMSDKSEGPKAVMSAAALQSVDAALGAPTRARTDAEKRFDEIVLSAKRKPEGHTQKPISEAHQKHLKDAKGMEGQRLYTVTTMASSARYGGTRTVAVCSTFEHAKEMVEENQGDIFELSYEFAIIEAVAVDWLYYILNESYWYVWEGDQTGAYKPIEVPEAYANTVCFGIG